MKKIITILTAIATCASMSARMMFYTDNDVEFYLKIVSASAGTISADGTIITFASRAEAKGAKLVVQEFIKADSSNPSIQQVGSTFSVNDKSISLDNGVSYSDPIGQEKEYTLNGKTVTTDCFVSCFAYANKRGKFFSGTGDATWGHSEHYTWAYNGVDHVDQMTIIWASSFDDPNYDNSTETAHFQGDASDAFPFTQFEATIGDVTDGTYTIDIIDSWEHAELGTQNGTFINVDGKNKILVTNHPGIKIVVGDSGSSTDDPGNGGGTDTTQFPIYQGDEGTEAKPYLIKTIDDLNTLAADVNSGNKYSGIYFKLESDLDYSGVAVDEGGSNFTPIGWAINSSYEPNDFQGNFDGGDHTISGVKVKDNTHDKCGLFGSVTNGTIKNLKVTNSSFSSSCSDNVVGGIVGAAENSTVENCHTTGDVTSNYATGGIVGVILDDAKIIACTSAAAVKGVYVGGILGKYNPVGGSMQYCFYYGSSVTKTSDVGSGSGYGALYGSTAPEPLDCYYQSSVKGAYMGMDNETSQHGYTITLEDGIAMSGYATEPLRTITLPSGDILKIYNDGYSYLGQRYFRYGATVTLSDDQTVDNGYTPGGYTNTDGAMGPEVFKEKEKTQEKYNSSISGNILTMGTCNVTISVSKTPITYDITYDLAGGTVATANPATYNIETDDFTLTNPTKTGYDFAGWKLEGSTDDPSMTVTITKGSLGDRTYTATWTITTYNITYDLAGGTVATANPTSYTVETDGFTLNNPTRDGYDFRGWQGTDIDNLSTTVTITKGSTGNRTYTALWKPNSGSGDWSGHAADNFEDINTDANTLSIASEAEMALFAKDVSSYAAYTVMLTKDLDLKDYLWKPIDGFNGTFDGQGHTISGVMIESTDESQGLFGTIGTAATVKNLVIANSSITGGDNTGAVVGRADAYLENIGTIENCHVLGDVIIAGTRSNHGGIAGYGNVIACTSAAIIRATDTPAGGIVGSGDADNCLYYGTILPTDASTIGTIGYGTNYQTYDATTTSHKYVRVYDADPGIMGTATKTYADTGYKVYEKGVSYGGKFYTAVVALTEDGITDLAAYAGQKIDVAFGRSFDALGTSTGTVHAATICLPFSFEKPETSVGKFYTFGGVTKNGDDYTVTMTEVSGTEITAGTPYMFVPAGSGAAVFGNTAFTVPAEGFTAAGKTENGGWAFTGTYTEKTWESGQTRLYGFAGTNFKTGEGSDLNDIGAFQRFGYGTTGAFRCYLMAPEAAGTRGSATALPETMRVVLKGADGSTTAIGTIDTRSGEAALDGNGPWYTLSGQRLQGKPAKAGLYIHNNKKVVIK